MEAQVKKFGIVNLSIYLSLAAEIGNVGDQMGRTKGMARYMLLTKLTDEVIDLGSVDHSQVKNELSDLDSEERAELKTKLKAKLDLVDDDLEMLIEEGVDIITDLYGAVERAISLTKKFKKAA